MNPTEAKNVHVCVAFYLNDDYKIEYVTDRCIQEAIRFNSTYKPGRFYFVDNEYVCGGMLKEPYQQQFINKCKARLKDMNLKPPKDIPYMTF